MSNWLDRIAEVGDALLEKLNGHLKVGPMMFYGANAMDWQVEVKSEALGVALCFHPPTAKRGWCFYASPNATPWAAVLGCGPGLSRESAVRVAMRLSALTESPHPEDEVRMLSVAYGLRRGTVPAADYLGDA